jgi:hypothetical protein
LRCAGCGHQRAYSPKLRLIEECAACGKQHSILAGTIFEQTKSELSRWFLAIYLVTSSKGGISAMELKRQMGFGSYQTAWSWLPVAEVARQASVSRPAVWRWQRRFAEQGVSGLLRDKTRPPSEPPRTLALASPRRIRDVRGEPQPARGTKPRRAERSEGGRWTRGTGPCGTRVVAVIVVLLVLAWAAGWFGTAGRRPRRRRDAAAVNPPGEWARRSPMYGPQERPREQRGAADGRRCRRMGGMEEIVMWKPAAAVIIVTIAEAVAHAQQQQSPIENLDKTMSELAQEGYEIKAAEDLSEDMPKFVLQKAESIIICQMNFSDGEENCFQLRSRSR